MATLTITINLDTAAFEDAAEPEVARILAKYSERLQSVGVHHARPGESAELFTVLDYNGRPVGAFTVTG